MKIKPIENIKEIQIAYLEVILMPNGEIISRGKTIGFISDPIANYKEYLYIKENEN